MTKYYIPITRKDFTQSHTRYVSPLVCIMWSTATCKKRDRVETLNGIIAYICATWNAYRVVKDKWVAWLSRQPFSWVKGSRYARWNAKAMARRQQVNRTESNRIESSPRTIVPRDKQLNFLTISRYTPTSRALSTWNVLMPEKAHSCWIRERIAKRAVFRSEKRLPREYKAPSKLHRVCTSDMTHEFAGATLNFGMQIQCALSYREISIQIYNFYFYIDVQNSKLTITH